MLAGLVFNPCRGGQQLSDAAGVAGSVLGAAHTEMPCAGRKPGSAPGTQNAVGRVSSGGGVSLTAGQSGLSSGWGAFYIPLGSIRKEIWKKIASAPPLQLKKAVGWSGCAGPGRTAQY